jgi:hypothetical protein
MGVTGTINFELEYTIGSRQFELSNHLGNVLAVISDWKVPVISGASVATGRIWVSPNFQEDPENDPGRNETKTIKQQRRR